MDFKKVLKEMKMNSIKIRFNTEYLEKLPIGTSKFGGRPDLPKNFKWYYYDGKMLLDTYTKNRPLSFLAQINCEEIKKYDLDNKLPEKGMLYFFYELESMTFGDNIKDKGSAKVYYYEGNISELVRTDFPDDMEREYKLPQIKLSFENTKSVPDYEEICEELDLDEWGEYNKFMQEQGYTVSNTSSKLLGYADCIQGPMLYQCEMVSSGIKFGEKSMNLTDEQKNQIDMHKDEWKLLFQLDSVSKGKFQLDFYDCGKIYYYIREKDLKDRNFENIWLVLECS